MEQLNVQNEQRQLGTIDLGSLRSDIFGWLTREIREYSKKKKEFSSTDIRIVRQVAHYILNTQNGLGEEGSALREAFETEAVINKQLLDLLRIYLANI